VSSELVSASTGAALAVSTMKASNAAALSALMAVLGGLTVGSFDGSDGVGESGTASPGDDAGSLLLLQLMIVTDITPASNVALRCLSGAANGKMDTGQVLRKSYAGNDQNTATLLQ
jgi:hypothetical protein